MLFPDNIELKLSFDEIRALMESYCSSVMGAEQVAQMSFMTDLQQVKLRCGQTDEFIRIITSGDNFPSTF